MSCYRCGVDEEAIEPQKITHHTMYRGKLIVVENVPARVCAQCGETYFHSSTSERLQEIVWKQAEPFELMEVPVFQYAETKAASEHETERTIAAGD